MVDYTLFHFAAPPRTGVRWFLKAAQLIGLGPGFPHQAHMPFGPRGDNGRVLRVSMVRHPCTWLASCYSTIIRDGLQTNHVGKFAGLDLTSFDAFLQSYLRTIPGSVGELYNGYMADSCMRIEDVPDAFLELADSLEVPRSLSNLCRKLGRQDTTENPPAWDRRLWRRVLEAERDVTEAYDYF